MTLAELIKWCIEHDAHFTLRPYGYIELKKYSHTILQDGNHDEETPLICFFRFDPSLLTDTYMDHFDQYVAYQVTDLQRFFLKEAEKRGRG